MGRQVGWCQSIFQGFSQQMKIDGDQQPAKKNSVSNVQRQEYKSQNTDNSGKNPIGTGHKMNDTLLDFQDVFSVSRIIIY